MMRKDLCTWPPDCWQVWLLIFHDLSLLLNYQPTDTILPVLDGSINVSSMMKQCMYEHRQILTWQGLMEAAGQLKWLCISSLRDGDWGMSKQVEPNNDASVCIHNLVSLFSLNCILTLVGFWRFSAYSWNLERIASTYLFLEANALYCSYTPIRINPYTALQKWQRFIMWKICLTFCMDEIFYFLSCFRSFSRILRILSKSPSKHKVSDPSTSSFSSLSF